MKPGVFDMPEREYRALDALNFSRFKACIDSPKRARWLDLNPGPPTLPMLLGSLTHCCVLTPELVRADFAQSPDLVERSFEYVKTPEGWTRDDGREKAGPFKTKKEATDSAPRFGFSGAEGGGYATKTEAKKAIKRLMVGQRVVTREQINTAFAIADAVEAHPAAGDLLHDSDRREFCAVWEEKTHTSAEPVLCKARIDGYSTKRETIFDLKTAQTANPWQFSRVHCRRWHYDAQIAWYARGFRLAAEQSGETAPSIARVGFIIAESNPPHEVSVAFLRPAALERAENKAKAALAEWVRAEKSGEWFDKYTDPVWIE
jgi:hypothetical protein